MLKLKPLASLTLLLFLASEASHSAESVISDFTPPQVGSLRTCETPSQCGDDYHCSNSRASCEEIPRLHQECSVEFAHRNLGFGPRTKVPTQKCVQAKNRAYINCTSAADRQYKNCLIKREQVVASCQEIESIERQECLELASAETALAATLSGERKKFRQFLRLFRGLGISGAMKEKLSGIFPSATLESIRIVYEKESGFFSFLDSDTEIAKQRIPGTVRNGPFTEGNVIYFEDYIIVKEESNDAPNTSQIIFSALMASIFRKYGSIELDQIIHLDGDQLNFYLITKSISICNHSQSLCE